jgi:CRISPR-associated protein Csx17
MADDAQYDLELPGCTPEPLMAYLKALGILRLVAEQKDPDARGWWKNDTFWLRSKLDKDGLLKFFLEEYKPTPIVAPWAGGSGFFKKDNQKAVEELSRSASDRLSTYQRIIQHVRTIVAQEKVGDKPKDEDKARLIRRYRRELPDEVVAWIDAAMVVQQSGQAFAPLLGTGGNDGRLDFTQNFMQRILVLGLHNDNPHSQSTEWLEQALLSSPARLNSASVGQFAPGRAGGPNATQGMEGDSTDNPWDFILMMEGALVPAGAAVRRFGVSGSPRAAFPFTVRAIAAGFDSPSSKDEAESRGELWLPLWEHPTSAAELRQLFGEGRAEVSGRAARDGTDFARAVAGLGVDRGIAGFCRLAFLKRSGKAFLAAPLGRFKVVERSGVDLLREVDPWIDSFRRAAKATKPEPPPRFPAALRAIDSAIFDFCKYGGAAFFQRILVALGVAERELARAGGKEGAVGKQPVKPLAGLSARWIEAADDGSREFAVARSLASVRDDEGKIGPLRVNLEPVDWEKRCRAWAEKDRAVVWNAADLPTNLVAVLARRMMDGDRKGCENLPLASAAEAPLHVIAAFIAGELDDQKIEDLLWGLCLVQPKRYAPSEPPGGADIPAAYALLKLLFLPRPLVIERRETGGVRVRYAASSDEGMRIRPEPRVVHLLRAGRLGEACAIAMRRLRASGLAPIPRARAGRTRDRDWEELDRKGSAGLDPMRLAAALLIPISDAAVSRLVNMVTRTENIETETELVDSAAEGD